MAEIKEKSLPRWDGLTRWIITTVSEEHGLYIWELISAPIQPPVMPDMRYVK